MNVTHEIVRERKTETRIRGMEWHEIVDEIHQMEDAIERRNEQIECLLKGIHAVTMLIDNSTGVDGLHPNGDSAPWTDLLAGGCYEEWLYEYSQAQALMEKME